MSSHGFSARAQLRADTSALPDTPALIPISGRPQTPLTSGRSLPQAARLRVFAAQLRGAIFTLPTGTTNMARGRALWLAMATLLAINKANAAQGAQAPGPAPTMPGGGGGGGGGGTPTQQQMSAFAAAFNQDILLNSDLYSSVPEILSGGLGFTNIIGAAPGQAWVTEQRVRQYCKRKVGVLPGGTHSEHQAHACQACETAASLPPGVANLDRDTVRAANGTWRANVTCANGQAPPTRVLTSAVTAVWNGG